MNAIDLASRLCEDMVRKVAKHDFRSYVITHFSYPDGDSINLYVERRGEETRVSDLGTTMHRCNLNGVEMTPKRAEFISTICKTYGVDFAENALSKQLTDDIGVDCLDLCQSIIRVSNLEFDADTRQRSRLKEYVDRLLQRFVAPKRPITSQWTAPSDHRHAYPVDFHMNSVGDARNIFHVASSEKSTLVSAVCNYLKLVDAFAPTMAIIDPKLNLGEHQLDRLQISATELRWGVEDNEEAIVKFALSGMK